MDKITGFQLTGMSLSGFKSFSEPTEMSFGNPTVITGGNGMGKSSIADAIAFAITGVPFFGEKKIDRMHSDDNPNLYVCLRMIDGNGTPHELIRTRKAGRTTLSFDGREIRQLDLTDMFGERDVFLSIFNPLYFIEELGEDGKNLLQRHLPMISNAAVLAELSEPTRSSLQEDELRSPEAHIKQLRESVRELENSVIYLQGQMDMADSQRAERQKTLKALKAKLSELYEEQNALETKRYADMDRAEMEAMLTDLSAQHSDIANDRSEGSSTDELDSQLLELNRKLADRSASVYESKFIQPIAEATERVRTLGNQYKTELASFGSIVPGYVCPSCRRAVTEADIPAVKEAFKESVNNIVAQGKEQRAQLDELKAMDAQSKDVFQKYKDEDIAKLEATIQELTEKRASLIQDMADAAAQRQAQMDEIRMKMQSLTSDLEYGKLTIEEYGDLNACGEEIRQVKAEIEAQEKAEFPSEKEFETRIQNVQDEITALKGKINCLLQFIAKRAEMTLSQLKMNRVSISLFDVVKTTGEVKDVFKFEYNGRRYDRLSLSEKIRAGMEVSELIKRLTGRNYPVFVDNMESVDDLNNVRPTGQILMAKCVSRAELNIRPAKPILAEIPNAA